MDWLSTNLKSTNHVHLEAAIQALMNLLMVVEIRVKFAETPEGIARYEFEFDLSLFFFFF